MTGNDLVVRDFLILKYLYMMVTTTCILHREEGFLFQAGTLLEVLVC
jgi:hypothetical protein